MTTLITADKAIELLESAVAKKGADYVYPRETPQPASEKVCAYTRDGEPSCGVGYALFEAGVSIEGLARLDNSDSGGEGFWTTAIHEENVQGILRNELDFIVTDEAIEIFSAFQASQDGGSSWGFSLDSAKRNAVTGQVQP